MQQISDLPNIGKELERRLQVAGVNSADELKTIGSCKAFQLLHAIDINSCINTLFALEGAVQEIRWHDLDPSKKQELKDFYQLLKKSGK